MNIDARFALGETAEYRWLPEDELLEVLMAPPAERADLFIAVAADPISKTVSLIRGDSSCVVAPFGLFLPSGDGLHPNFSDPTVGDYGHSIVLGDYEAAGDAILYETDAEYRKKLLAQRRESEQCFGASLRRLRLQRRLTQNDFPGVTAKTVERGEVAKPHGKTLKILAETLAVNADDIETY